MKQKWTIFLLLALLVSLWGCAKQNAPEADTGKDLPVDMEPPCCLSLYGMEEVERLFSSVTWTDEEFQTYIEKENFVMNGINCKEDVTALKEKLLEVPFPMVASGTLTYLDIRPDDDIVFAQYEFPNGEYCKFRINFSEMKTDRMATPEQEFQLWNDASFDYNSYDRERNEHMFVKTIDECAILYLYYGAEGNAYQTIEEETTFSSLVPE